MLLEQTPLEHSPGEQIPDKKNAMLTLVYGVLISCLAASNGSLTRFFFLLFFLFFSVSHFPIIAEIQEARADICIIKYINE